MNIVDFLAVLPYYLSYFRDIGAWVCVLFGFLLEDRRAEKTKAVYRIDRTISQPKAKKPDQLRALFLFEVLQFHDQIPPTTKTHIKNEQTGEAHFLFLRLLRLMRVFRIFKLGRYTVGGELLQETVKASASALGLLLFFAGVIGLVFSSLVYFLEMVRVVPLLAAAATAGLPLSTHHHNIDSSASSVAADPTFQLTPNPQPTTPTID